ncbi:hypothetical protein PVOR_12515 [Paenibacillus vortex V453]|uniref:Uncharacterized protein n=1 Tax=Paenibacillus vortex V453 TaxID=715225 RepID=A0A2R9SWM3_9BACL|nr:hypothetical protein PVOR_12515 [Paenibacillus vortex V453]
MLEAGVLFLFPSLGLQAALMAVQAIVILHDPLARAARPAAPFDSRSAPSPYPA